MSTTHHCRIFKATTAYTSACTDARAALAPQLSGGPRVPHWQSAPRLWPDMRRLQQISNDPPRMGAKSTTTGNHPSTPVPCGTPELTAICGDVKPSRTTDCFLFIRKVEIQVCILPLIPYTSETVKGNLKEQK